MTNILNNEYLQDAMLLEDFTDNAEVDCRACQQKAEIEFTDEDVCRLSCASCKTSAYLNGRQLTSVIDTGDIRGKFIIVWYQR